MYSADELSPRQIQAMLDKPVIPSANDNDGVFGERKVMSAVVGLLTAVARRRSDDESLRGICFLVKALQSHADVAKPREWHGEAGR